METSMQFYRPLSYKAVLSHKTGCFMMKPLRGVSFARATVFTPRRGVCPSSGLPLRVTDSKADYSKRKNQKLSAPNSKGLFRMAFTPNIQAVMSTEKRDQKNSGEKEDSIIPPLNENAAPNKTEMESNVAVEEQELHQNSKVCGEHEKEESKEDIPVTGKELSAGESYQNLENGSIASSLEDVSGEQELHQNSKVGSEHEKKESKEDVPVTGKELYVGKSDQNLKNGSITTSREDVSGLQKKEATLKSDIVSTLKDASSEEKHLNGKRTDATESKEDIPVTGKELSVGKSDQNSENGSITTTTEDVSDLQKKETTLESDIVSTAKDAPSQEKHLDGKRTNATESKEDVPVTGKELSVGKSDQNLGNVSISTITEDVSELQKKETTLESDIVSTPIDASSEEKHLDGKETDAAVTVKDKSVDSGDRTTDEAQKLKLEIEANLHKQEIEKLAEETYFKGYKVFVYPQIIKPDEDIEVFFNRSFSYLNKEPDVRIKGAFNKWRWEPFTERLYKSPLKGDWWTCLIHVPKEAYQMDFVFFNGQNVYENNDEKDFFISVEGGMGVVAFEEFCLEEKLREIERNAKELAEEERKEEEQRRIEAEKAATEADRAQARVEIERRREILQQLMRKASISANNIWFIEPIEFQGENMVKVCYNKSSGPLAHSREVWIHGGYNNWKEGLSIVGRLFKSDREGGDWWYVNVDICDDALVLDWVFADKGPKEANVYDNNHNDDFHAIVPKSNAKEHDWVEEENQLFRKLYKERKLREEATRVKAEKRAQMKAEMKKRTLERFMLSQKHIVYTEPLDVHARSEVTVFYNPTNTVLKGKPEVWFRCSFNRWTHRVGPLPPQKMLPADNGSLVKATVKVPLDAYMMDFVFSEKEDGGIFDNKSGMDYHIPVSGGVVKEPPMRIVHIAIEMAPIAKVGGLGDVVTSLSRAVQDLNHKVDIILPKYDCLKLNHVKDLHIERSYYWGGTEITVWFGKVEGLSVYFLEPQNGFFWKGCVYGCSNDRDRFGFFCHAALEFLKQGGFRPDIIHCHDWSSAPVSWLFKDHYQHDGLSQTRVAFTIHNLEFGADFIGKAMQYSDKATTVSHKYSKEVAEHPVIAPYLRKFRGILNGIDLDIWDPYNDNFIPISYTSENVVEGKKAAKEALQQRVGLAKADLPLVGVITRLTHQKGIHLIQHAIWRTIQRNGQVVLLGSAPDPRIQNDFVNLANQLHSSHGDRARLCLTYDEPLSHLIYAGADFILVPSIFEPCGLTQLIAMRYGSVPVVRETGGLYDTVFDVEHDKDRAEAQGLEPNGFSFAGADNAGVDYALNRAISGWYDRRDWFYSLCKKVMEQDWSWNRPALEYLELYHAARKN